jgi:outer membrane protein OmpA-like peptidoglycan-associated protein
LDNDGICDPWVVATGSVYLFDDLCVGRDACPDIPEDMDRFQDEDGCPDPDNDQDSICDPWVEESGALDRYAKVCWRSDRCPNEAETQNGFMDEDGCRDSLRLVRDDIRFEKGDGGLQADGLTAIDEVMTILLAHPNIQRLRVRVTTSEASSAEENQTLSQERAETLVEYMILSGIDESKLVFEGIGEPSSGAPERAEFLIEDILVPEGHAK